MQEEREATPRGRHLFSAPASRSLLWFTSNQCSWVGDTDALLTTTTLFEKNTSTVQDLDLELML